MDNLNEKSVEKCHFCHKVFNLDSPKNKKGQVRTAEQIYNSCSRHIDKELLSDDFFNWSQPDPLPFCQKCYICTQKLSRMSAKLEEMETQIQKFVNRFTCEFVKEREINSTAVLGNIKTEKESLPSDEEIDVEDNQDDNVNISLLETGTFVKEEVDDLDFDVSKAVDIGEFDSDLSDNGDFDEMETSTTRRGRGRSKKSGLAIKSRPKAKTLNVEVNLSRLQYNDDGKPIPDNAPLTSSRTSRRKRKLFTRPEYSYDVKGIKDGLEESSGSDTKSTTIAKRGRQLQIKIKKEMKPTNIINTITPKCKICGQMFSTNSKLKSHLLSHSEGRPFSCKTCNFPFKAEHTLRRHESSHSTSKVYKCPHCSKSYKRRHVLNTHINVQGHHKDLKGKCELCKDALSITKKSNFKVEKNDADDNDSKQKERRSKKTRPSLPKSHVCEHCGKICESPSKLKLHLQSHTGEKNFGCPVEECEKRFYSQYEARRHAETHTSLRKFKCDHCDKTYKYQRNVKEHIIKYHPDKVDILEMLQSDLNNDGTKSRKNKGEDSKDKYMCLECKEVFRHKISLHCHKYSHLPPDTEITCTECDAKPADLTELQKHVLIHSAGEKQYLCSFCGMQFKNKASQSEHEILHYNLSAEEINEKYFPCPDCDKIFISNKRLQKHCIVHTKDRPCGPCEVCGLTFKTIHIFNSHKRIHHPDRTKFQCSICEKLFSSRGCLNKHMYLHSEEKMFNCFCGKKFSTRSALTAHSVYHKTDKPYLCEECGQGYYTGTKLREHYRIHTGNLLFCEFCDKGFKNSTLLKQHHIVHDKSLAPARPKRVKKAAPGTVKRQRKSVTGQKQRKMVEMTMEPKAESEPIELEQPDAAKYEMEIAIEQLLQFQCGMCEEWFEGEDDINNHMVIHNDVVVIQEVVHEVVHDSIEEIQ